MARLSIIRLLAYIIGACGGFMIVNSLAPQITAMIPGGWIMTFAAGVVLVIMAIYVGRR